jgi:hypothetical protein
MGHVRFGPKFKISLHSPWSYNKLSRDRLIIKALIRKIFSFKVEIFQKFI